MRGSPESIPAPWHLGGSGADRQAPGFTPTEHTGAHEGQADSREEQDVAGAAYCTRWAAPVSAAAELEQRMTVWLRDLLGLPETFTGAIQDSASSSTLCGIVAACDRATQGRASRKGLAGEPPLIVYASEEAHSSVEKGARIAGVGADNVRSIAVRDDYGMDPDALDRYASFRAIQPDGCTQYDNSVSPTGPPSRLPSMFYPENNNDKQSGNG